VVVAARVAVVTVVLALNEGRPPPKKPLPQLSSNGGRLVLE